MLLKQFKDIKEESLPENSFLMVRSYNCGLVHYDYIYTESWSDKEPRLMCGNNPIEDALVQIDDVTHWLLIVDANSTDPVNNR